jgi:ATP-dependent 26S proteasome regulatory subunit
LEIYVGLPDFEGRKEILTVLLSSIPEKEKLDAAIETAAARTGGFSGAELSAICEKAKLVALRDGNYRKDISLSPSHLLAALEQVLEARAHAEKAT